MGHKQMSDCEVNSTVTVPDAPTAEDLQRAMERAHSLRSEAFVYTFAWLHSGLSLVAYGLARGIREWLESSELRRRRAAF